MNYVFILAIFPTSFLPFILYPYLPKILYSYFPFTVINQVDGTERSWIDDLPNELTGIDSYDKFVSVHSMLGATIRAIAASWGVSETEVAAESIVGPTEIQPDTVIGKDWRGKVFKARVIAIINPRRATKDEIIKLYEID